MKSNNFFRIALSVFVSFVFVFAVTYAATTISTNISTGGTLSVTDTSTLTGAVTLGTDLTVTSGTRVGADASGGHITALANDSLFVEGESEFDGISWFDGSLRASTTLMATGAATLYSTLDVTSLATFLGGATTTTLTLLNGETITNATDGTIVLNAATTSMTGGTFSNGFLSTASSTVVGNLTVTGTFSPTQTAATSFTVGGGFGDPGVTISAAGAISADGLATLAGGATTTILTLLNGEIISNGTDGVIQLGGIASTTSLTLLNGETITNATDGTIALTGALTVSDVSSFTGLATFLGGATTTILTLLNGEIISNGTDGVIQLGGVASTTSITLLNGETITNATDGTIALTGALTVSDVSSFTGLATFLGGATTTILTLLNGEIISNGTDGVIQLGGIASTTSLTLLNGETITNATDGEVQITATTLKLIGTASTSALIVGDEPAAPTINGMVFGYCSFGNVTLAASTTEGFADCTTVPAGALVANDRVFVQATSSFESMYVITAASTTGASTIQLRILNTGLGVADGTLGGTSINFWAVR